MGVELLLALIVGAVSLTVVIMFLPAVIELRHPQDAGPRVIRGYGEFTNLQRIVNIEEEVAASNCKVVSLPMGFLDMLPNIEVETI